MLRVLAVFVLVVAVCGGGVLATTNVVSIDGDSRPALTELQGATDPLAADTDGDGLDDDTEVDGDTDPVSADTDADGLDDGAEVDTHGTDPTEADSDGDTLEDGAEVETHGTDPTVPDTDDDGLTDAREIETLDSDPTARDTDGDGLRDGREVDANADPTTTDTDGDGLDDHAEVVEYDTEPNAADTDNDGLTDGGEVFEHGTEPRSQDTDSDGLHDGDEVNHEALADADPLHKDVFVELDYLNGERPSDQTIDAVVQRFADAPVENPDGSTGIALHVRIDDATEHADQTTMSDLEATMVEHFDHQDEGYIYALAVNEPVSDGRVVAGVSNGPRGNGQFMFHTDRRYGREAPDEYISSHFMHELGHSLGLSPHDYQGIDSQSVPYTKYRSSMNYDAPRDFVGYNDGAPFDDWEHIVETAWAPTVGETV